MDKCVERLKHEGLNLIILKDGCTIFTSTKDGMLPLLEAIDSVGLHELRDSVVIDKIVGKAAALLMCYFNAGEAHCEVSSLRAQTVLDRQGIKFHSEKVIPEIRDKTGTDICPFEKTVIDVEEPEIGYKRLLAKMEALILPKTLFDGKS